MTCGSCRRNRGLGTIHAADGAVFLRCLLTELGLDPAAKWGEAVHAALYERASHVLNLRGDRSPEEVRLVPFRGNPQEAANFAVNLPMGFAAESPFWSCLGIAKDAAVTSLTSKSGAYWNAAVGAGYTITRAEGGAVKPRPGRGSIVAALLTLAGGTGLMLVLGD